jgi:hypothetical protein
MQRVPERESTIQSSANHQFAAFISVVPHPLPLQTSF